MMVMHCRSDFTPIGRESAISSPVVFSSFFFVLHLQPSSRPSLLSRISVSSRFVVRRADERPSLRLRPAPTADDDAVRQRCRRADQRSVAADAGRGRHTGGPRRHVSQVQAVLRTDRTYDRKSVGTNATRMGHTEWNNEKWKRDVVGKEGRRKNRMRCQQVIDAYDFKYQISEQHNANHPLIVRHNRSIAHAHSSSIRLHKRNSHSICASTTVIRQNRSTICIQSSIQS